MESPQGRDSAQNQNSSSIPNPDEGRVVVVNVTRNTQIANRAEVAGSGMKRSKGLLGRKGLAPGEGMWIIPCEAVHTFFMQFPIDLIYLDRNHRVKKIKEAVPAWRLSACLSAHSILELPAGTIRNTRTERGDVLQIVQSPTLPVAI
jgi:uncharacterized protein